jgi:hypothetical protein
MGKRQGCRAGDYEHAWPPYSYYGRESTQVNSSTVVVLFIAEDAWASTGRGYQRADIGCR